MATQVLETQQVPGVRDALQAAQDAADKATQAESVAEVAKVAAAKAADEAADSAISAAHAEHKADEAVEAANKAIETAEAATEATTAATEQLKESVDKIDGLEERVDEAEGQIVEFREELDAMQSASDVVDVVDNYAALLTYDTKDIHKNDVVKVLNDEEHNGAITYYRYVPDTRDTSPWQYIGETGPYYTKSEADEEFASKSYVDEKIEEGGGSLSLLAAYNSDATDDQAYSAKYINKAINYKDVFLGGALKIPGTNESYTNGAIAIGNKANARYGDNNSNSAGIAIGADAKANNTTIAIGNGAVARWQDRVTAPFIDWNGSIAIGHGAIAYDSNNDYAGANRTALGYLAKCTRDNELSIGNPDMNVSGDYSMYSKTRFIANVKAGELDTDAVNLKQMKDYVAENAGESGSSSMQVWTAGGDAPWVQFTTMNPTVKSNLAPGIYLVSIKATAYSHDEGSYMSISDNYSYMEARGYYKAIANPSQYGPKSTTNFTTFVVLQDTGDIKINIVGKTNTAWNENDRFTYTVARLGDAPARDDMFM